MNIEYFEKLSSLGLQDNEARVYLALLELGRGNVTEVSKAAGLNRTTGYDILERLGLLGLVNRSTLGKKKLIYVAEPPSAIKQFLEDKKHLFENRLKKVDDLIFNLNALTKGANKPIIKFFEGRQGIKNIYLHSLRATETILSILDFNQYIPEFDQFGFDYMDQRAKLGIKEKVLAVKNDIGLDYYQRAYNNYPKRQLVTEYRWLKNVPNFSLATEVNIYDDKVMAVLAKPGENIAFEIQSQSFANTLKTLFNLSWQHGEILNNKKTGK
ncbi:MAG: helix-turn-helix domain-containing protein [Patescibacteria group bacterium]|jgi:sugar-specific transcriptional regulator TrmB